LRKGICDIEPRVHQAATKQRTRRAVGIAIERRRKNFIVPPYMLCGVASKATEDVGTVSGWAQLKKSCAEMRAAVTGF
jgi:hypothetical protein